MRKLIVIRALRLAKHSLLGLAVILVLWTASGAQSACGQVKLARVERGRLEMDSGSIYRILDNNGANISLWLPLTGVVICEQVTDSGELYYSISNQDTNETVLAVRER